MRSPVAAEEEGLFGGVVVEEGAALQEVAVEPEEGVFADGDEPLFLSLAVADVEGAARRVEVGEVEEAEFPPPRAGGVEGFEDGAVADAHGVADVGDAEQGGEFFAGESPGEPAGGDAGHLEVGGGVGGEAALADEPGEEAFQRSEALFLRGGAEGEAAGPPEAGEVALVGLEAGAVDLAGAGDAAFPRPLAEGLERPAVAAEGAGGVVEGSEAFRPFLRQPAEGAAAGAGFLRGGPAAPAAFLAHGGGGGDAFLSLAHFYA